MGRKIETVQEILGTIIEASRVPALVSKQASQKLFIVNVMAQEALDTMEHTGIDLPQVREILHEIVTVSTARRNAVNVMPEWTLGHVWQCSAKAMLLTRSA